VLLPRNDSQRKAYSLPPRPNLILLPGPIDGANLIAHSDLVVSAGGTMNREAAALGIPASSIYLGKWAALDQELVNEGRLRKISTLEDLQNLPIQKKGPATARRAVNVLSEVVDLILED
jgi:predicted glycosyltransferase